MVEQLICNQQVAGSSPITSSKRAYFEYVLLNGRVPEWPKGTDCKSAAFSFGGSNPPSSTTSEQALYRLLRFFMQKIRVRSFRCSSSFAKKSRSRRLLICKRIRNAFGSLPTFCKLTKCYIFDFIKTYKRLSNNLQTFHSSMLCFFNF